MQIHGTFWTRQARLAILVRIQREPGGNAHLVGALNCTYYEYFLVSSHIPGKDKPRRSCRLNPKVGFKPPGHPALEFARLPRSLKLPLRTDCLSPTLGVGSS